MLRIAVASRQGLPLHDTESPPAVLLGPDGGSIGRAGSNTLVLDDPDRTVSRVHAQVQYRDGRFVIVDRGSNPLLCDGRPVGQGNAVTLRGGERLTIGSFELSVTMEAAPTAPMACATPGAPPSDEDPFADLLGGLGTPPADPPRAGPAAAGRMPRPPLPAPLDDPMAGAAGGGFPDDPFADLLPPAARAGQTAGAAPPDDFSDLGLPAASGPTAQAARIEDLFGGVAGGAIGGVGDDPLALSPLADPLLQPNTAARADDPLAAFGQLPVAAQAARSDHLPIGQFGFEPPRSRAAGPPAAERGDPRQRIAPHGPASPAEPAATDAPVEDGAVLLAAFLRGLGPLHQAPTALTPALMERVGSLLRTSTEGTLQLLHTRQALKREVRAEVTLIASQANNPLKFSPTVDVALAHLLGPTVRGFMPAEAAMRDACDDLRAHQFGVMVGMRAALARLIERFAPGELEKKIAARSALDNLFAASRKARLWDQFAALYATIASEAEDDFHALFGQAFLQAYEEQMQRLRQEALRAAPPHHESRA